MDPQSKKLLEDIYELASENNKMLHSMRRSQRISSVVTFIYWAIIIGSIVSGIYFFQPYFNQFMSVFQKASSVINSFKQ